MPTTASKRQVNVRNVTFTPVGGTAVTFGGVTSCSLEGGGTVIKFSADGDRSPTTVINDFVDPTVTLNFADLIDVPFIGARGTLQFTFKDARNANTTTLGTGDLTYTMTTAVVTNYSPQGTHRQFSTATMMFSSESIDGITVPLSVTVAA